jgi:glyoxylase-like metal-dependent hydrolase (beta-lactamase superfamily II)
VLCTHLHADHVGWNTRLIDGRWVPTFPNARYLFARQEWEHWRVAELMIGDGLRWTSNRFVSGRPLVQIRPGAPAISKP